MLFVGNTSGDVLPEYCFVHSWYLATDFQIFLFVPVLVYIVHKNQKIGIALLSALIAFVLYISWLKADDLGLKPIYPGVNNDLHDGRRFPEFYLITWYRAAPYLLGIILGTIYMKNAGKTLSKNWSIIA